jgi:hypothetical protein
MSTWVPTAHGRARGFINSAAFVHERGNGPGLGQLLLHVQPRPFLARPDRDVDVGRPAAQRLYRRLSAGCPREGIPAEEPAGVLPGDLVDVGEYALHGVVEVETDSAHYLLPPLIREMMIDALWWPIDRGPGSAHDEGVSDGFFRTLAELVSEALDHEAPLSLPTSENPIVAAAWRTPRSTSPP